MSIISEKQEAYCKVAQLYELIIHSAADKFALEKILPEINDVNIKILKSKSKKYCLNDSRMRGSTPLHIACYHRHIKVLDNLLERGADFTVKNDEGCTALYYGFCRTFLTWKGELNCPRDDDDDNVLVRSVLMAHVKLGIFENPRSANGLSHFHIACAANHVEAIQLFLNNGACVDESVNVNSPKFPGYTPLHFAVAFCGYEATKLLLEQGASVKIKDTKGLTPLHLVIDCNFKLMDYRNKNCFALHKMNEYIRQNEKMVRLFVENNCIQDIDSIGLCRLHAACTLIDSSLNESLLQYNEVNSTVSADSSMWPGYTPLHFAAHFNINTVKLLLEKGANIGAEDAKGVTPFDLCKKQYSIEDLHSILMKVPAFENILFSDNKTKLLDFVHATKSSSTLHNFFQSTSKNIFLPRNCPLWPGFYLSHLALIFTMHERDNKNALVADGICNVKACISFENSAVIQDARGRTPIHLAFYQQNDEVIDLLLEHQSTITDVVDNDGLSHLHIACSRANERIVRLLLLTAVDVNGIYKGKTLTPQILSTGSRPLHFAVVAGNVEIIKMLLQYGADANATNASGMTPIHRILTWCPLKSRIEIGDLLFSSCHLENVVATVGGSTHLHVASALGNEVAVAGLLKLGADANAELSCNAFASARIASALPKITYRRLAKHTPLHYAVIENHTNVVKLLLQGGADCLHKKSDGMTLFYEILNQRGVALPFKFDAICSRRYFASILANDAILRKRVEEDTGITLLHIACALCDGDLIRSLLIDSAMDVNAQVHSNSPIWAGATPLHILIFWENITKNFGDGGTNMKLLLDCGADITLTDDLGNTPLHNFLRRISVFDENYATFSDLLRLLLEYQKDFSFNPINAEGISHFHIACMASQYIIVEKFLKSGVDVNLPIDHRYHSITYETALHAVLRFRSYDRLNAESRIRTIDLLLKYGADVNAQDNYSTTPLFEIARGGSFLRRILLEKLFKAGADINYTNLHGKSVLESLLLSTDPITDEECTFLSNNHVNINKFNPITHRGILMAYRTKYQHFFEKIIQTPTLLTVDKIGRTAIHNIVSNDLLLSPTGISVDDYANFVERLVALGYDIDAQDNEGQTALHMAALHGNETALFGLLSAGADINVSDMNNKPAITINFQARYQWDYGSRRDSSSMEKNVALHIVTMQLCGLEVNAKNIELANSLSREQTFHRHCKKVLREIEMSKQVAIGTGTLLLKDFLSETGIVASRPMMASEADREAVDKLFEFIDVKIFPHLRPLFKLQHRKTLKRILLMDEATDSLQKILESVDVYSIPEICLRQILRFLTNTDVKNLIASTTITIKI